MSDFCSCKAVCGRLPMLLFMAHLSGCEVLPWADFSGNESCQRKGLVYDAARGFCAVHELPAQALSLPVWDGTLNMPGSPEAQALDGLVTGQGHRYGGQAAGLANSGDL